MATPETAATLVGRQPEVSRINALLAPDAGGGALVISGDAGMGKSALLQTAADSARAQRRQVLAATCVQSEARFPYGTLRQLLRPVLRKRAAALDFRTSPAPDVFATGLAVLELLGDAAMDAPMLLVVDDAHWMDPASAIVLAFVARRLVEEPVALLAATRPAAEPGPLADLPRLDLAPLSPADAARLVETRGLRDPRLRDIVLREAAGNPLALLELPLTIRSGDDAAGPRLPLSQRLERAFSRRLDELPPAVRTALLVAAAHDATDLREVLAATRRLLGDSTDADVYEPAAERGLLTVADGQLRFSHPLIRSAAYQASRPWDRARAHQALAATVADEPDRRAWHLAAAALAPDAAVADEVAAAAERAQAVGATPVVQYALERAAALTPPGELKGRRLLRAAEFALELGSVDRAATLLREAATLVSAPVDRCRVALVDEGVPPPVSSDRIRIRHLVGLAAEVARTGDAETALRVLYAAALHVYTSETAQAARDSIIDAALALPVDLDDPRVLAVLALADPHRFADAIERGLRALLDAPDDTAPIELVLCPYLIAADRDFARLQHTVLDRLRTHGHLRMIPLMASNTGCSEVALGRWGAAKALLDEGQRIAEELGQQLQAAGNMTNKAILAAYAGDERTCLHLIERAEAVVLPAGYTGALCAIQIARAVNALAQGRNEEAYADIVRTFDPSDPAHHRVHCGWGLSELAVSARHSGSRAEARRILNGYETGQHPITAWTAMTMEFARPLLAADDDAEALFLAALSGRVAAWPVYRARLLLEYGVWMRRRRRVAESRHPLRTAREAFDALGMAPWAARARTELRAAGEGSAPAEAPVWLRLSPQELQIAQLAAEGRSNREIGLKLFLSHRTVGSHLYRIFPKLGITSRSQLRDIVHAAAGD